MSAPASEDGASPASGSGSVPASGSESGSGRVPESAHAPRFAPGPKVRSCADGLSVAGWAMAVFALALCTPPFEEVAESVFLVGSIAIAPVGSVFSVLLACTAVAFCVAGTVVRARFRHRCQSFACTCGAAQGGSAEGGRRRAIRWIANGFMVGVLAVVFFVSGIRCLLNVSYVADPPSPAGDRVVVVERNVLLSGNGTVYFVSDGFGFGVEIARYGADDGYSPMGNGTYVLEWCDRVPAFEALGTLANPVVMYPPD